MADNIVSFPDDPENFQRASSEQGRQYEALCEFRLRTAKWKVLGTHMSPGDGYSLVDIVAEDPNGGLWWIECKGSYRGNAQGMKRGDTVKKALGDAYDLAPLRWEETDSPINYMIMTSHFPERTQNGYHMVWRALDRGIINRVWNTTENEVWE